MTPKSIALVQSSWAKVKPLAEPAAQRFYERLFALYPDIKPLFQEDMAEQHRKFMAMLDTVVEALEDIDALLPTIEALGEQHACYGVADSDYDKVADALLWTLTQQLGADFTPDLEAAWIEVYTELANAMREGAAAQLTP